jgi:uncharacterized protein YwgA
MSPAVAEDVAKYARLVAIVRRCGTLHSRLKVHKIFYILKSLGYPVREGFDYRHYGPYSGDLASELRSATNAEYLREAEAQVEVDEDEEPHRRYDYSVGPRGSRFVESQFTENPTLGAVAGEMAELAAELNESLPLRLELVATLMFLQDMGVRPEIIANVLRASKPHYTEGEVREALEHIAELRGRATFAPPPDLGSIIGLIKDGPPSDAAGDLDEEVYGGE